MLKQQGIGRGGGDDLYGRAQELLRQGARDEDLVLWLHSQGVTILDSIKVFRAVRKVCLEAAKSSVTSHPVWRGVALAAEELHDEAIAAARDAGAVQLTYYTLTDALLELLPELRAQYEEEAQIWGEDRPGPHIVYGDILTPYLGSLLESREPQTEKLKVIFDFLETMASHPPGPVRDVLGASVLERITDEVQWLNAALPFMGHKTRALAEEIRNFWH